MFKRLFGRPIRKVKAAAVAGVIVPVLIWVDAQAGLGIGDEVIQNVGKALAALIVSLLPVFTAYLTSSAAVDIDNIPR